jgi:hypothetical protein
MDAALSTYSRLCFPVSAHQGVLGLPCHVLLLFPAIIAVVGNYSKSAPLILDQARRVSEVRQVSRGVDTLVVNHSSACCFSLFRAVTSSPQADKKAFTSSKSFLYYAIAWCSFAAIK